MRTPDLANRGLNLRDAIPRGPMWRARGATLVFLASFGAHALGQAPTPAPAPADPAPPALVAVPADAPVPQAKPHPALKFHAPAQPLAANAATHDWASFLGPTHNAVSTERPLLKTWPATGPAIVWEMAKGSGYSSPGIAGDRLVFHHRLGDQEVVQCLRPEDGQLYWEHRYATRYRDRFGYNNGPRASPVIDGERVYTLGAEGALFCLHLPTGRVMWSRRLREEFPMRPTFFGVGCTPLIEGDRLIVNLGAPDAPGHPLGASVAAFDKLTGKLAWTCGQLGGPSYASPIPATVHGKRRVFVFTGADHEPPDGGLIVFDPVAGRVAFEFPWRSKSYESVNAACPVVVGHRVFISASYETGGACLELAPDGSMKTAWKTDRLGTHWNTTVHKDGYLYGYDGRHDRTAELVCLRLSDGQEMWREDAQWVENIEKNGEKREMRMTTARGCLLAADGGFIAQGEFGHLLWLDLTPQGCKTLARHWMFAAPETWALPVLSRGLLYVTQNTPDTLTGAGPRLRCYDLRGR